MADTNVASTARAQHAKGLHSHAFLPSVRGPILGLWESKVPLTPEEMEFYLEAPDGPLGDWGALVSRARPVAPMGAVLPASAWDEASAPELNSGASRAGASASGISSARRAIRETRGRAGAKACVVAYARAADRAKVGQPGAVAVQAPC